MVNFVGEVPLALAVQIASCVGGVAVRVGDPAVGPGEGGAAFVTARDREDGDRERGGDRYEPQRSKDEPATPIKRYSPASPPLYVSASGSAPDPSSGLSAHFSTTQMNVPEYAGGMLLVGAVVCAFWVSGCVLAARLTPGWDGALGVLVRTVTAISVAVFTCQLLGLFGWLTGVGVTVAAVGGAVALRLVAPRGAGPDITRPPRPRVGRTLLLVAVGLTVLTAVRWAGPVLHSLDAGIYRQDSTWYHLPFAAWFAQTGSIGGLLFTDPLKLTVWYYPLNSELLHSAGMVLLGNDLASPLINFCWMCLALLGAWCIGRPFGLAAATLLGTVLVVDSDMMLVQAGNAPSDIVALACLIAAIAILVNGSSAAAEGGLGGLFVDPGPLAVAALAAGLAVGSKVTMLAPVGVITIGILTAAWRRGLRRRALIWIGGLFTTGGFWYLRNLVHAGNPLPWFQIGPLPGPSQENLYPRPAHSMAEYLANRHAWTDFFFPGFAETLGPPWSSSSSPRSPGSRLACGAGTAP